MKGRAEKCSSAKYGTHSCPNREAGRSEEDSGEKINFTQNSDEERDS